MLNLSTYPLNWNSYNISPKMIHLYNKTPIFIKTFHKTNNTWAHYEHDKSGIPIINPILAQHQIMGPLGDQMQKYP